MKFSIHLGMSAGIVLLLLFSCSTMPRASVEEESLLVITTDLEDPLQKITIATADGERRLSFSDEGLILLNLEAGEVRVNGESPLTVAPGTVMLYPKVFSAAKEPRETTPADQRRVMTTLTDYVGFESWFGREYLNFGPFRPKQYLSGEYFPLQIESSPAGSLIRIDNVTWGETPQTLELNAGKYLVEISSPGYKSYKRIITLDAPLNLSPELEALTSEKKEQQDSFEIMVAPVLSLNSGENPYGDVIASTLAVNFNADPRLEAVLGESGGAGEYPDFGPAEEIGADLLVAGRYHVEGDSLYLEAVLYETTTRRVKFAETYLTEAGFAVFDSIDEVSARFAGAVARTLPEAGEPIIEKEAAVTDELLAYEKSIFRDRMIQSRLERRNLIAARLGFGGLDDRFTINGDDRSIGSGGIPNLAYLSYQRVLGDMLAFSSTAVIHFQGGSQDDYLEIPSFLPAWFLMFGPEFAFRTEASDVYFTPTLALGFRQAFSATDTSSTVTTDVPVRFYTGLELDVGYRYFFFRQRDDRPWFMNVGMHFDMADFAFSLDGDWLMVPIRGGIYLGGGVAL